MVEIEARYDGSKKCTLDHAEGARIGTDAPRDIGGDASAFSPTDLVAAALASCILTTMAMFAERHGLDLTGIRAHVSKDMNVSPRRIRSLPVTVTLPESIPADFRETLERVGHLCPVHASLHPDIDAPIEFRYE
ncbi:MAG: OsmC family protein [Capsulimonadaceae bacterium]